MRRQRSDLCCPGVGGGGGDRAGRQREPGGRRVEKGGHRDSGEDSTVRGNLPCIACSALLDDVADSRVPRGMPVAREQVRRNKKRQ